MPSLKNPEQRESLSEKVVGTSAPRRWIQNTKSHNSFLVQRRIVANTRSFDNPSSVWHRYWKGCTMYLWTCISVLLFKLYFFVVKLSGSTVMFPLDSNLDTFSLCREACRGAIVMPWCHGANVSSCSGASHLLGVPRPMWCTLSLLHQSRFHVNYYCHDLRRLLVWGLYLEQKISSAILHSYSINCPSTDTTPFVTALDITSMSCVVLVILEHTLWCLVKCHDDMSTTIILLNPLSQ